MLYQFSMKMGENIDYYTFCTRDFQYEAFVVNYQELPVWDFVVSAEQHDSATTRIEVLEK